MSHADSIRSQVHRLTRAEPFRSFTLRLNDGGRVPIDRPQNIAYDPDPGGAEAFDVLRGTLRLSGTLADVVAVTPAETADGPIRWSTPVVLPLFGLLLGSLVGVATNAVNAAVSTPYYRIVLGLDAFDAPGTRAVVLAHGVLEGGALGLAFGLTFAVAAAASTRLRVTVRAALPTLLLAVAVAVVCWTLGGAAGLAWAAVDPKSFRGVVPPSQGFDGGGLRRFAWVGGSIWGAYAGAAVAAVAGCVHLHVRWRAVRRANFGGRFPVGPA